MTRPHIESARSLYRLISRLRPAAALESVQPIGGSHMRPARVLMAQISEMGLAVAHEVAMDGANGGVRQVSVLE